MALHEVTEQVSIDDTCGCTRRDYKFNGGILREIDYVNPELRNQKQ